MIKKFIGTISIAAVGSALLAGAMLVTLSACEQQGPAEKAGEQMDSTMEEAGEQMDSAVEEAGEQMEKAGDSIRDTTTPSNN